MTSFDPDFFEREEITAITAEFGIIPATVSGDSEPFDTPLPVDTRLPRRMQPYLKIRLRTSDPRLHVYRRIRNPRLLSPPAVISSGVTQAPPF